MDTLKGTTTRLRKTFHYPDDATDSQPEAIDEQEQDQLIQTLATQNSLRNDQFRRLLVALPLLAALPYVPALARRPTAFLSLLALTSLASTAYLARAHPPGQTGIDLLDSWARPPTPRRLSPDTASRWSSSSSPSPAVAHRARRSSTSLGLGLGTPFPHRSPLELYLPYLNLALCVALLLTGLLAVSGTGGGEGDHLARLSLSFLPALVYAVVLASNVVMGGVDPERELGSLKYDYKGA